MKSESDGGTNTSKELEVMCDMGEMGGWLKETMRRKGVQQIIRCKNCAYHSPDKEAYLLKGRVCEPFAHAWNCYVQTCCQKQPKHGRPH